MGHHWFCRLAVVSACALAMFVANTSVNAQLNDDEGFNYDAQVNTFFAVTNPVPFWSVEPGCSPAMLFKDNNKGDGGSTCLRSLIPVGTGTRRISDLNPGAGGVVVQSASRHELDLIGRFLVILDNGSGNTLYRALGPVHPVLQPVVNTMTGDPIPSPQDLWYVAQGTSLFTAENATSGRELWKVTLANNLTIGNADMLVDINPGPGSSSPSRFANLSATLALFTADNGTNGRELYSTNLTGATMVLDINKVPDPGDAAKTLSSDPQLLTTAAGKVFFTADDGVNGRELWRSDGVAGDPSAGTGLVKEFNVGPGSSNVANLTAGLGTINTVVFFTVNSDGANGSELWRSAGALGGADTSMVFDPGAAGSPAELKAIGGTINQVFFTVGNELWKSGGTSATTFLVKAFSSPPTNLVATANAVYFLADDGSGSGVELWKTDGTTTAIVKDIRPGPADSAPQNLFAIGGVLYFSADDGTNGRELWRTDATAGAVLIKDINPGPASSNPVPRGPLNDTLFFTADDGTNGAELWQTDGNETQTRFGMGYKWDLSGLIQSKGDPSRIAVAGTNEAPFSAYFLLDAMATGGTQLVSDGAHQLNVYVELTDGTDRAPLDITMVPCGDGGIDRPKAALTDGSNHNALAFGMVAVLDQDPCDTDPRIPGSPGVPVAHVPAVYDGNTWIPMDMVHIPPGVVTAPPTGTALSHNQDAWSPPDTTGCGDTTHPNPCPSWPGYLQAGFFPANIPPVAATVDPWGKRRFNWARIDVWTDYITVWWGVKQIDTVWAATLPRQYKGAFKTLYFGNKAGLQNAYPTYLDTLALNGGILTPYLEPGQGACCLNNGSCADVGPEQCGPGRYSPWKKCGDTSLPRCCPIPWADSDGDSDVDMDDYGKFQACFTGSNQPVPAGCECLDKAKTVPGIDLDDFAAFLSCVTGPSVPMNLGNPPSGCTPQ